MTESDFLRLQSNLNNYAFYSMEYIDYYDVSNYEIVLERNKAILLYGYHQEAKCYEYHWASNSAKDILDAIDKEKQCLITFVPHDWIESFENAGFVVRCAWHDYFMDSLESIPELESVEFLKEDECEAASEVTMSCLGQSRGFTGQTTDWIRQWLGNSMEDNAESDILNKAIFIERNDNKVIIGIICTGTYAHESEKGAIVWIREVAVKPEYQRRGIASRLITQAIGYGKSFGAKRAFLAADECNIHAIHLYESIGFKASNDKSQIDMIKE